VRALRCVEKKGIRHNNILTVIDYSLPSGEKRLWVFDMAHPRLLYHTHVSHGLRTGVDQTQFFSNRNNSKASSLGVLQTAESYYGRYGLALKLHGLERHINHNAYRRFIVMHGGWYVDEEFIEKYGRSGRSWGCPALPPELTSSIIHTIKDGGLIVVYYPDEQWLAQSRYLNCDNLSAAPSTEDLVDTTQHFPEGRGEILFVEKNNNQRRERDEPILVMSAQDYQQTFDQPPPLKRMLRRQIQKEEFVALSHQEFKRVLDEQPSLLYGWKDKAEQKVFFVTPEVKRLRGYYATEFKVIGLGDIVAIRENNSDNEAITYTIEFHKKKPRTLRTTERFIRWLGL